MTPSITATRSSRPNVLPLRPHQQAAREAVYRARNRGVRRMAIAHATGSGKTILAAHLISDLDWWTVFLAHRQELIHQTVEKLRLVIPDASIGVLQASRDELGARFMVVSAQTVANPARLERLIQSVGRPLLLISDECHHDAAPTRLATIRALAPDLLIGLSATPLRGDRQSLGIVYEELVHQVSMLDLMAQGQLAQLVGVRVGTDVMLDQVRTLDGDFHTDELSAVVDTRARNRLIVRAWQKYASERKRTVVFAVDRAHAHHITEAFQDAGITAETILGNTPAAERSAMLTRFQLGELPVLTNVNVLSEGWDCPLTDAIVMARPTKSLGYFIQAVGRGARTAPGKKDCLLLDVVDATSKHKLLTLASLIPSEGGEEGSDERAEGRVYNLLDMAVEREGRKAKLARRTVENINLFQASQVFWRDVAGVFMAPAGRDTWVIVRQEGEGFRPYRIQRQPGRLPLVDPLFDRPIDSGYAMGIAEGRVPPDARHLAQRDAAWRQREEPPTESQVNYAHQLGIRDPEALTKADLSTTISDKLFTTTMKRVQL